jgi:hypothetical protein
MSGELGRLAGQGFGVEYGFPYITHPGFFNGFVSWTFTGSGGSKGTTHGGYATGNGTITHPTIGTAIDTQCNRTVYTSSTTANNVAGLSSGFSTNHYLWRGNGARLGGFIFSARFTQVTNVAATRMFVGVTSVITTAMCAAEPSGVSADFIGVGFNAADSNTNLRVMWKDGSTYGDVDLGANAARASGSNLYDLYIYCYPNDTVMYVQMFNVYSSTTVLSETAYSSNIPRNTVFMSPTCMCGCAASGGAPAIGVCRVGSVAAR